MDLNHKNLEQFQEKWKKVYKQDLSLEEARKYGLSLLKLYKILFEIAANEKKQKEKLKEFPKGYHLTGVGYNCCICSRIINNEETWYDSLGIKCLSCQSALNDKIVPKSICKNKKHWYDLHSLQHIFDIHPSTAKKLIKKGILKARIIRNKENGSNFYIFLKKENIHLSSK